MKQVIGSGRVSRWWLIVLVACLAAPAVFAQTIVYTGALGQGDAKLGKYFDSYPLQLSAGDRLVATLRSEDFDAYLLLEAPDGTEFENDDYGESNDARLDVLVENPGEWRVKVTSFDDGEEGRYRLVINREKLRLLETHVGALEPGDPVSIKGEYYDTYTVQSGTSQRILVSLQSDEFDTFLVLKPPRESVEINDDYLSETESRIDTIATAAGTYQIYATSYLSAETGSYTLRVFGGQRAAVRELSGFLDESDPELEEYGYYEEHPLYLEGGEHIVVEMTSEELDTVVVVQGPNGFFEMNDDFNDLTHISRIDLFAEEEGEYRILAVSYDAGVGGNYRLKIYSFGAAGSSIHSLQQLVENALPTPVLLSTAGG
jgi:hypothetical protein